MTCKACKFDHPAMQDCRVAARIRGNTVTAQGNTSVTGVEYVTPGTGIAVTEIHPNVTVFADLGFDKLKWPKSGAQRVREHRARKSA